MSLEESWEIGQATIQIKRIADILTASQHGAIDILPGVTAYFLGGTRDGSGNVVGHGTPGIMVEVGNCPTGYDGNSFFHLGNGTNYLRTSSGFGDIIGTETWISSSIRGLTVAGWFMIDDTPATEVGLASKSGAITDFGYGLLVLTDLTVAFFTSGTGSNTQLAVSAPLTIGAWSFLAGRFIPSTEVAVFANGDKTTTEIAIPSEIFASSQEFEIGRYEANNARIAHAKARDVFVCASALTDEQLETVRQATRPA